MLISLSNGTFKCFGCGESGDAMKFVRLMNKQKDDLQACKEYFKVLRSKKVKHINIKLRYKQKKENGQALIEANDYYFGLRTNNWNEDTPERRYMQERGFKISTLEKCKAKINYNEAYPIIFPMMDMGNFKGWVCRTMNPIIQKKRKYLYNEGFSRATTLVGRYDNEVVMVVEGYMDWLKAKQNGVKYVVAILGWKMTGQQIEKLKEAGVKIVISALDNDKCGIQGTQYLKQFFKVVRFAYPSNIKDTGEMTKQQFSKAYNKTKQILKEFRRSQNGKI